MKKFVLSSTHNKRLISQLMSSRPNITESENFTLKGSNDFLSRSNNVFGELESLEQVHETWVSKNDTHESFGQDREWETDSYQQHSSTKKLTSDKLRSLKNHDLGSKSLFKKPPVPHLCNRKKITKNKMNKWTKYSLADVPLSSDATNAATALSFINELRKRKAAENEEQGDQDGKIVFSKPKPKSCSSESFSGLKSSSSKTPTRKVCDTSNKNANDPSNPVFKIKLDHLEEEMD